MSEKGKQKLNLEIIQETLDIRKEHNSDFALGFLLGYTESKILKQDLIHVNNVSQKMVKSNQSVIAEGYLNYFMNHCDVKNLVQKIEKSTIKKINKISIKQKTKKPKYKIPYAKIIQALQINKNGITFKKLVNYLKVVNCLTFTDTYLWFVLEKIEDEGKIFRLLQDKKETRFFISKEYNGQVILTKKVKEF